MSDTDTIAAEATDTIAAEATAASAAGAHADVSQAAASTQTKGWVHPAAHRELRQERDSWRQRAAEKEEENTRIQQELENLRRPADGDSNGEKQGWDRVKELAREEAKSAALSTQNVLFQESLAERMHRDAASLGLPIGEYVDGMQSVSDALSHTGKSMAQNYARTKAEFISRNLDRITETRMEIIRRDRERAAMLATGAGAGRGAAQSGGVTASQIEGMSDAEYQNLPQEIRQKYLRGEI